MTKKNFERYHKYMSATTFSVKKLYGKCSQEKLNAEEEIIRQMHKLDGYGYKAFSASTFNFSAAFEWWNAEEGCAYLEYYTRDNHYTIKLD